jgi:hypothetical protein
MSETFQNVHLPSFIGWGHSGSVLQRCHQVLLEIGMIGGIPALGFPIICSRRKKPVSGKVE